MFSIIITAGGIGKRMNSTLPKQFLEIDGEPILMKTIKRFHEFCPTCEIIVTLPVDWISFWEEMRLKYLFTIKHRIIEGGEERYDSIKNAVNQCEFEIIGIHDGVRPFPSDQTIQECLDTCLMHGTAIPTFELKESLRKLEGEVSLAVKRSEYVNVQTPQFFQKEIITKAYELPFHSGITDDASLVEEAGFSVTLCQGNEENIKITTPMDLLLANLLITTFP